MPALAPQRPRLELLPSCRPSRPPDTLSARHQLAFMERILNAIDAPFYVIRPSDHSIVLANTAAQVAGIQCATSCYSFTHRRDSPCDGADHPCPMRRAQIERGPVVVEHTHFSPDGTPYHAEIHGYPIFNAQGDMEYFVEYSLDITARKHVEEQLRVFHRAFEHSASAVLITNLAGEIEYVNPAYERITGYTSAEAVGKRPNIVRSGLQTADFYADLWATIQRGHVWRGEITNVRKNGEVYWEQMTIAPIKDPQGRASHYVAVKEDITDRKRSEQELERLASTDPLTGLSNRRHLFDNAETLLRAAARSPAPMSALMVDIDHFKNVNDKLGHAAGDTVLQEIAVRLGQNLRSGDLLGRVGGEEFAILLPATGADAARGVAERLRLAVSGAPIALGSGEVTVTISLGVAVLAGPAATMEKLLRRADEALYAAKRGGRNRAVLHEIP